MDECEVDRGVIYKLDNWKLGPKKRSIRNQSNHSAPDTSLSIKITWTYGSDFSGFYEGYMLLIMKHIASVRENLLNRKSLRQILFN